MLKSNFFVNDNGEKLPINIDKYLLSVLSPTSDGTNYWESPPPSPVSDRQRGRMILQVHQILDILISLNELKGKKNFLDIGTGNGMIPRLMLELSNIDEAVGTDPFLDGEHKTSWQKHDHDDTLIDIRNFINKSGDGELKFSSYSKLANIENMSFKPVDIVIPKKASKSYRFEKISGHELNQLNKKFDLIYCKAIEHIHEWVKLFDSVNSVADSNAVFYLKHRSFFSYLGGHRYANTGIPWGHVILTEFEYKKYVNIHHRNRSKQMIDFYFKDLAYPRYTVTDMIRIAHSYGFLPIGIKYEPPKYLNKCTQFINQIDGFYDLVWRNYPRVSLEELMSGIVHIVFKKE